MERIRRLIDRPSAVDLALWVVVAIPVVLAAGPMPEDSAVSAPVFRVGALVLLAVAVPLSRRLPLVAALMPAAYPLAVTGQLYSEELLVAQPVLAFLLGRRTSSTRAAVQLGGFLAVVLLTHAVTLLDDAGGDWVELAGSVLLQAVLPWTAGQYVHQYAELLQGGWELAKRLDREREVIAAQVRLRERARIATDMHDSLGHELSLIAVRAAALEVAPDVGAQGQQAAGELRRAAAAATDRLREIIGVLREDGGHPPVVPADDTVTALVRRAAESGMPVRLEVAPAEPGPDRLDHGQVPDVTARAAYRVVQEALTNAARHAPGAPVTVTLRLDDADNEASLAVAVVNEGPPQPSNPGQPAGADDRGHGLIGLDERVRLAGGTLRAEPNGRGFAVRARLPLIPRPAPPPTAAAPLAKDVQAAARRRLRRGVLAAFWAPAALVLVLVLLYLVDPSQV